MRAHEARDPLSIGGAQSEAHFLIGLWELLLGKVRGPLCRAPLETSVTLLPTNTHTQNTTVPGFMSGRGSEGTSGKSICSCRKQRRGVSRCVCVCDLLVSCPKRVQL